MAGDSLSGKGLGGGGALFRRAIVSRNVYDDVY